MAHSPRAPDWLLTAIGGLTSCLSVRTKEREAEKREGGGGLEASGEKTEEKRGDRRKRALPARLLLFILKVCKVIKILLRLFSKHLSPISFFLSHTL